MQFDVVIAVVVFILLAAFWFVPFFLCFVLFLLTMLIFLFLLMFMVVRIVVCVYLFLFFFFVFVASTCAVLLVLLLFGCGCHVVVWVELPLLLSNMRAITATVVEIKCPHVNLYLLMCSSRSSPSTLKYLFSYPLTFP